MKAGLVTFYHIHHYGALLQAAATERAVERFGWDCEIIDYFVNQDNALFKRPTGLGSAAHDAHTALHYQALSERYRRFEKFSRDHLRISDRRYGRFDELAEGPLPYDLILSGSDQIWNPKIFPDGRFDPVFFGTFSQKRRIAYAPSFGVPTIPEGMQAELKGYLDGFSHLSARETQGSAIIHDIAGKDAPVVLDPTLLLTADQWDSMADHPANYPKGGYILCYCINRPGALTPYLERLHQETGLPVVQLCGIRQKVHPKAKQILDAGPAEFLGLFQNAAYVVTNSFHGTVFSVQFHRPFFTTVSPAELSAPERSRTVSILSRLGLANRVIGKGDTAELLSSVNWDAAEAALAAARQELGNPVLVVDSSFRTLAMEPEQPIGIDSWDRILQGEAPQRHDLKQAEAMIENFSARNLTGLQTVPYTEPDGRPVRRMVGPVVAPDDGRNCGGLEIIELEHPFAPEDEVLAQRLLELLQHYLVHAAPTAWRAAPEERFLQELLFCEPAQQSAMQKKLHRFPALEAPPHFYLASIPLSQAHRLTRTNQQALLAHEWPEGWFMQTETAILLLLPGTGDTAQPEQLLQKLQEVGLRMGQTVILSMPFPSLLQLGTVWRFNQEAAATARDLHCGAGCRSASALYQDVFVCTIAQSANLRAFIHPMLRRLQEYDQAHSTALLHTLCVYLLQEQNLHATARQLFIHRNTLVYRLQRIRALLQLDLDDAAVRNVLRTGCILLEYYQGAF